MTFSRKDTNKSARGAQAELLAEHFLQQQGLFCIERNYRCAAGEIDLIMRDQNMLVFVEVRLRSNRFFAQAAESVNYRKQHKISPSILSEMMIITNDNCMRMKSGDQKIFNIFVCRLA